MQIVFILIIILFLLFLWNTLDSLNTGVFTSSKFPNPPKNINPNEFTDLEKREFEKIIKKYKLEIEEN